jgi:hypothetical protein
MRLISNKILIAKKPEAPPLVPGLGAEKAVALRNKPGGPHENAPKKKEELKLKKNLRQQNFEDI